MKRIPPVHPFLFVLWFIIFFWSANPDSVQSIGEVLVPWFVGSCLVLVLWIPLALLVANGKKAALSVSCATILLFSYNPLWMLLSGMKTSRGLHVALFLLWTVLLVLSLGLTLRVRKHLPAITAIFNAVALFLLGISAVQIVTVGWRARAIVSAARQREATPQNVGRPDVNNLPNIYYIILDGYARQDILAELYEYDNAPFLDHLTENGFHVTRRSTANYSLTGPSLASSLNFEYLDNLAQQVGPQYSCLLPLTQMIQNNAARHLLIQCGYGFVSLSSGCPFTEMRHAGTYIKTGHLGFLANGLIGVYLPRALTMRLETQYHIHARSIQRTFERLVTTTELKPPVFVLAHILAPHRPFVFQEDGEKSVSGQVFWFSEGSDIIQGRDSARRQYRRDYKGQLVFMNKMVMHTIDQILAKSARPPVIVIQGDHGPASLVNWDDASSTCYTERMSILNAYLLPGGGDKSLYDEITPVNTFRIIANHYLGTSFPLLEDRCYYSPPKQPYEFLDVTAEVRAEHPDLPSSPRE